MEFFFDCSICTESGLPVRKRFRIPGCAHVFCSCWVERYVTAKVEQGAFPIGCPEPCCGGGEIHPEACRHVVRQKLFDRWGAALCERALVQLGLRYCPFKDCSAPLLADDAPPPAMTTKADCRHCRRALCARCGVPWHDGVDCTELERLGADERGREDLLLRKVARERRWQRCPRCRMYVERASGCNFMVCRRRHRFCYRCGSMTTDHRCVTCHPYHHDMGFSYLVEHSPQ